MLSIRFNSLHASKLRSNHSKLCSNPRRFKKTFQLPNPGWMPHFAQGFCLDLADPLASNLELPPYFFQRSAITVDETETLLKNLPFPVRERFQDILNFFLEQNDRGHVARIFGASILDEIAKVGFLALSYRRLQRDRLLCHL